MHVLILRPYRKDNIYFRTIEEREKIRIHTVRTWTTIHLSNVLTDHFSNPVSEKTRNDIPMKFLQCYFKTIFYRLLLPNLGIYLKSFM